MILVEVPLARQYLVDDALRTDFLCKVGLSQVMLHRSRGSCTGSARVPQRVASDELGNGVDIVERFAQPDQCGSHFAKRSRACPVVQLRPASLRTLVVA